MASFEWQVAMRYLRARRQDGFISVIALFSLLGIMLGVAALIIVMSVMNGFKTELVDKILGYNGHAVVSGYTAGIADYRNVVEQIEAIEGVASVTPFVQGQVMATNRGYATGGIVRGLPDEALARGAVRAARLVAGDWQTLQDDVAVAIGSRLADQLGLSVGSQISLLSPEATNTPFGSAPRIQAFSVGAIIEVGVYDYDKALIVMPLPLAQRFFRKDERVTTIEVFLDNPGRIDAVTPRLVEAIGSQGAVTGWRQFNASLVSALDVERNVMFIILTLIILVAAFNIISSLIMLVKDKSRDIAVMRTMGAQRGSILRIFIIVGMSIGAVGTGLGFALGAAVAYNIETIRKGLERLAGTDLWNAEIRFLSEIPAQVDSAQVALTVIVSLLLAFLATLPPSWRAARLDPTEVLRYE